MRAKDEGRLRPCHCGIGTGGCGPVERYILMQVQVVEAGGDRV